jgi:small-conductance mechanosensitive channel
MHLDDTVNQFGALLAQAKQGFVTALPNIVTALVVFAVGWGLAWALRRLMIGLFRRLAPRMDDHKAASVAAGGVYWLILVATVVIAVDALDLPVLRQWMGALASQLPQFAIAVTLVVGGVVLGRLASAAIIKGGFRLSPLQARRLARLTRVAVVVAATLIAAAQLGLDVSLVTSFFLIAWAAALAAAALAFGLGAQETIANILAMHYVSQSYRVGQRVRVGPDEGRIVRTTRTAVYLENAEGELHVPGRQFADSRCVLLSAEDDHGS